MEIKFIERIPKRFDESCIKDKIICEIIPRKETIVFEFIDEKGNKETRKFGVVDKEEIYKLINEGKKINLNHCYIEDFSLSVFREKYPMSKSINQGKEVTINKFSAYSAFFGLSKHNLINLKGAHFVGEGVRFTGARFAHGNVNFSNTKFREGNVSFRRTNFGEGKVSFERTEFGKGDADFSNANFGRGNVNFRDAKFGKGNMDFSEVEFEEGNVDFRNAKFGEGDVDFRKATYKKGEIDFRGAVFGKGEVSFCGTKFGEGNVSFRDTEFGAGEVYFLGAEFEMGDVTFHGAKFGEGNVNFCAAKFGKGNVDFSHVDFGKGDVDLIAAKFESRVSFSNSSFSEGNISFELVRFVEGGISFRNVDFGKGNVKFLGSDFRKGDVDFFRAKAESSHIIVADCILQPYVDMRMEKCEQLDILNCKIEKIIDMKWSKAYPVEIEILNVLNTDNLGKIKIDWEKNKVRKMVFSQKNTNYYEKAEQFRLLKENFRNLGQYDDEDEAYVEFKKCEMISKLYDNTEMPHETIRKIETQKMFLEKYIEQAVYVVDWMKFYLKRPFRTLKYIFKLLFLDKMGGFGTKPKNVFASMLITIVTFSIIYCLLPNTITFEKGEYGQVWNSIYHSVVTFLTIGYGNVRPENWIGIIISGVEGFIGLFLMSYFTVAFVRKILR